ncbi:hypothetical protein SBRY_50160 [Actinacidiphila bryophytorum]|uniref:Uncharacterized protein n=1 Tax=Actinacidiphila bryophytorum TaxID=1436133 RepID=A0A9W4H488_9ACTN|nr:hypothetical protein SBRY_50160 [Actinacidiphila bryophytorum]
MAGTARRAGRREPHPRHAQRHGAVSHGRPGRSPSRHSRTAPAADQDGRPPGSRDSQAQSAGSIPVIRSIEKAQANDLGLFVVWTI